ncbi:enolase 1 [Hordeum vulgare]|nr:enolase 1 [Hordeum vulgare]
MRACSSSSGGSFPSRWLFVVCKSSSPAAQLATLARIAVRFPVSVVPSRRAEGDFRSVAVQAAYLAYLPSPVNKLRRSAVAWLSHIAYLARNKTMVLHVPSLNVVNAGSHVGNKIIMQDFMILPTDASLFTEVMKMALRKTLPSYGDAGLDQGLLASMAGKCNHGESLRPPPESGDVDGDGEKGS